MHASILRNGVIGGALLFSKGSAGPAPRRAITEGPLDPWVSVDASGSAVTTVTPVLTTINGVATTIGAAPASLTATTTTSQDNSAASTTSGTIIEPTPIGGGSYQVCHNLEGDFAPFCKPDNGSSVHPGESYYTVTWDTEFVAPNASINIIANYVNNSDGGPIAFTSPTIKMSQGYFPWTIDSAWMKGMSSNNITLFINLVSPMFGQLGSYPGPTVEVANPIPDYYHPGKTPAPTGESLYIALPTVFGFVLVCVCGGFIWNRKHRKIGLGNVMGRRKGYGVGKSRSQRLGLGKKKGGVIQLREQELTAGGQYRDVPVEREDANRTTGHARADSDALGSLAGTPTEERTNYFRDEMRRQEQHRH